MAAPSFTAQFPYSGPQHDRQKLMRASLASSCLRGGMRVWQFQSGVRGKELLSTRKFRTGQATELTVKAGTFRSFFALACGKGDEHGREQEWSSRFAPTWTSPTMLARALCTGHYEMLEWIFQHETLACYFGLPPPGGSLWEASQPYSVLTAFLRKAIECQAEWPWGYQRMMVYLEECRHAPLHVRGGRLAELEPGLDCTLIAEAAQLKLAQHAEIIYWMERINDVCPFVAQNDHGYVPLMAVGGPLPVFEWILRHGARVTRHITESAAARGNIPVVEWILQRGPPGALEVSAWTTALMDAALSCGRLGMAEMLFRFFDGSSKAGAPLCSPDAGFYCAENGRTDCLRWAHERWPELDISSRAFDRAAAGGHWSTVEYILSIVDVHSLRESTGALDNAAAGGHLALVKLLCRHGFPCTTLAMNAAARCSDSETSLRIVEYLHYHRGGVGCTSRALDNAAGRGASGLSLVRFLHHSQPSNDDHRRPCTTAAMDGAAQADGGLSVLEFLHTERSEGCTARAFIRACRRGQLSAAQWLARHYPRQAGMAAGKALEVSAGAGHLEVCRWLKEECFPTVQCTRHAFALACAADDVDVVSFLLEQYPGVMNLAQLCAMVRRTSQWRCPAIKDLLMRAGYAIE